MLLLRRSLPPLTAARRRALCSPPLEYASSCWLPTSWTPLKLLAKAEHNHDTTVYDFGLPEGESLNLPVCACLLLRVPGRGRMEGGGPTDFDPAADAIRPYTPVSDNSVTGRFQLLIKRYAGGAVSEYLHALPLGGSVDFRHISFNVKAEYPFEGKRRITMLCGGTGIAPMYQALLKLMGTAGDEREVTLIFGNKSWDDVLLRDKLEAWAKTAPERFKLVHVIGDTPDGDAAPPVETDGACVASAGWIDRAKVEAFAHPPSPETMVLVCGVPAMYEAMCGPRTQKELTEGSVLAELGYTADMVEKM